LIILVSCLYLLGIFLLFSKPLMPEVYIENLNLLVLSLQAFILLLLIAHRNLRIYLESRSEIFLTYSLSFFFYSFLFLGMIFQSLGFWFADMRKPGIFLLWRQFKIIWISGIYLALSKTLFERKKFSLVSTFLLGLASYSWFFYGLFFSGVKNSIEFTMYGFLYFLLTPFSFCVGILFLWYGKKNRLLSPKYLSYGFILLGITYMAWSPWHLTSLYFVWFTIFNISLVFLLIGFSLASIERPSSS